MPIKAILILHRNRGSAAEYVLLEKPDGSSVFILDPVVREGSNVLIGTYARIQHVLTSKHVDPFVD